jgi:hypothetical protein
MRRAAARTYADDSEAMRRLRSACHSSKRDLLSEERRCPPPRACAASASARPCPQRSARSPRGLGSQNARDAQTGSRTAGSMSTGVVSDRVGGMVPSVCVRGASRCRHERSGASGRTLRSGGGGGSGLLGENGLLRRFALLLAARVLVARVALCAGSPGHRAAPRQRRGWSGAAHPGPLWRLHRRQRHRPRAPVKSVGARRQHAATRREGNAPAAQRAALGSSPERCTACSSMRRSAWLTLRISSSRGSAASGSPGVRGTGR